MITANMLEIVYDTETNMLCEQENDKIFKAITQKIQDYREEPFAVFGTMLEDMKNLTSQLKDPSEDNEFDAEKFKKMSWDDRVAWTNKVIEAELFKPSHGDAIHWIELGYRNEKLMFWHEQKGIIPPYTEIDDYGSVPPVFLVGDDGFEPNKWINVVVHNHFAFLDVKHIKEIKENARYIGKEWYATVVIKKIPYLVRGVLEKDGELLGDDMSNMFSFDDNTLFF
jgi:hypothetical protein